MNIFTLMNRKRLCLFAFFLSICFTSVWAQNPTGTVTGSVQDSTGQKLESVAVTLKGTDKGTYTDSKGLYTFTNVPEGDYTIVFQLIGYLKSEVTIKAASNETTTVPSQTLKVDIHNIGDVVVDIDRNKFLTKESPYVAKMPLKDIENPQVYNTINSELMKSQVVTNFNDAIKNAPGVDRLWESTGRGSDGAGYFTIRGFAVQPTMINGIPGVTNGGLDPANIERLEIIKGPSGTLYGSSLINYGGLINIVTKKPYDTFGGSISYNAGSFGLNRVTADVNTPLTKDKNVAVRINTAYHTENSFQDAGFKKSFFFAPSLSYKVNNRLSFLINTEFLHAEGTNPTMVFLNRSTPLVKKNIDELNYNYKRSYTSNDVTIKNPTYSLQAQMLYKLSEKWTSQTVVSRSSAKSDGYYSYLWDFADGNGTYGRYFNKQNSTTLTSDIQQNFIGDFKIGGLRNRVVAGLDYFHQSIIDNSTGYVGYDAVTIGNDADPTQLSVTALDTALAKAGIGKSNTELETYSAYVSDVFNITEKFSVMASLRVDHFVNKGTYDALSNTTSSDKYNQTALSPKFGANYQLVQNKLAVFANYMNGFKNLAPKVIGNTVAFTFKPEHANQWEVGFKSDIVKGKVSATISYYDIRVANIVLSGKNVNEFSQGGERYSKGIETSIIANPINGLNLIAGYSYNVSEINKFEEGSDYANKRPEEAGPQHLANAWINYKFTSGIVRNFGLGFGGNYASQYATLNRISTGTFYLPSYTIVNAAVSYENDKFAIAFKMNNLTDKIYYKGWSTINPQAPRNVVTSFTYKF